MNQKEAKPLAKHTATKLTKRYAKPAEWIGWLTTDDMIYIVARHRSLAVAIAPEIAAALQLVRDGDAIKVPHKHWGSNVPTNHMLEVTGLNLKCEVTEHPAGEIK